MAALARRDLAPAATTRARSARRVPCVRRGWGVSRLVRVQPRLGGRDRPARYPARGAAAARLPRAVLGRAVRDRAPLGARGGGGWPWLSTPSPDSSCLPARSRWP